MPVEDLTLLIVVVVVIEGLWLAGLTYLLWRKSAAKKAAAQKPGSPPADPPVTKST